MRLVLHLLIFVIFISLLCSAQALFPTGLPIGSDAPEIDHITHDQKRFRLSDYKNKTDLTLIFLRDKTCPIYKSKVIKMQDSVLKNEKNRRVIVIIAKDSSIVDAYLKKNNVKYNEIIWLRSTENYDIHKKYGTLYGMDYETFNFYAEKGYRCLNCGCGIYYCPFAVPSIIAVDRNGKISYCNINNEDAEYPYPSTLLELLAIIKPHINQ
ncbi:MAG: redoxin family protein [Bacteroidia bacterium]|nr:redoxin family protein [Bacteroidia bacterium]MDW8302356.1 redoxin family protein [Bacteroidia bacterium]